jgi:hypothetical protein
LKPNWIQTGRAFSGTLPLAVGTRPLSHHSALSKGMARRYLATILLCWVGAMAARAEGAKDPLLVEAWNEFRAGRNNEAAARFTAVVVLPTPPF